MGIIRGGRRCCRGESSHQDAGGEDAKRDAQHDNVRF
jgi:hypothetical protein